MVDCILPRGLYTALVTPFLGGLVDFSSLERLLEMQIAGGVKGVVIFGTTGESSTLDFDEKLELCRFVYKKVAGRVKVIAGTGSNNTAASAKLTVKLSEEAVCDGFLVITPYYNKATVEGLRLHFGLIAEATNLPVILYNVPARTGINMSDELISELASVHENIVGLKDATGDLSRVPALRSRLKKPEFLLLSGEDATALAFNASGGDGVISVVSNVAPRLCAELQEVSLSGNNFNSLLDLQERLFYLSAAMFCEVNPIPVKYALSLMGYCAAEYRLPLCLPSLDMRAKIKEALKYV